MAATTHRKEAIRKVTPGGRKSRLDHRFGRSEKNHENGKNRGKNRMSGFQPRYEQVRDSGTLHRGWKPLLHAGRNDDHTWMRAPRLLILCCALLIACFIAPWSHAQDSSYHRITGPCDLEFPRDHGPHPGFQTEWWYYTGNLQSEEGSRYGFQLTFFRRQITPPGNERGWPQPHSAWRTQQIYLAHAALSDITARKFTHVERIAREAVDLAGSSQGEGVTTISLGDWSASMESHRHILLARADDFAWEITLTPVKNPVLHGDSGYSRKGKSTENASCYYSLTRLQAEGTLTVSGRPISIRGTAWMDHEFSSSPLDEDIVGWDWLSLQFSDNSELMIYMLRNEDGSYNEASSGTFVDALGMTVHLRKSDFSVEVLDHWKSPRSRALYPSRWRITIPSLGVDIAIHPNLEDQELETPNSTRVTYWEGSVTATGEVQNRRSVSGTGYVELTGYASPLNALR